MTCPQCQLPNPVGTSYCARCGTPLAGGAGVPAGARSGGGGGSKTLLTVIIVVVVGIVGCAGIGIIAAIAIPSLLRARVSANESGAIGDIRTVISAEAAYQSANAGYYDTLECMGRPCIPNYSGPTFIDPQLASGMDKSGYKRRFHPGAPPQGDEGAAQRSPSSLSSFAYTAVPIQFGKTGVRGFCGDSSGRICVTLDGTEPPVENGECSQTCQMLR